MSLFVASINSGSNGNCYYAGNGSHAVLIDAGLSCRETERRMHRLGLDMASVKAIFISHEHIDHIKGVESLSAKYNLPVYINEGTHKGGGLVIPQSRLYSLAHHQPVKVGPLLVMPFNKFHDAAEPMSFTVTHQDITLGVFTDLGHACNNLIHHFNRCHAAYLEANYDEQMLAQGHYPPHLKRRISSNTGHLSNRQALELFMKHRGPQLSHLFLSHLSRENNDPELAAGMFAELASGVHVSVASRYRESEVFHINGEKPQPAIRKTERTVFVKRTRPQADPGQISLFNTELQ